MIKAAIFAMMLATPHAPSAAAPLPAVSSADFARTSTILANGIRGEIVSFESHSPTDWGPAMRGEIGPAIQLNAQLFLPEGRSRRQPAVIMVPGSGNLGTHHLAEASALTSKGLAVLLIDPFRARGISDTIADQGRLTWPASAYDVLAAVKYLRTRRDIDAARIGALGTSRGGTAVMMAAAKPFSEAILGKGKGLRTVMAGYPWCGTQFRSARLVDGASLLVLQGDRDDWVSVQQCQDAVHAMIVAGQDASMRIVAGAAHAFDRTDVPPTHIPEAVTSTTFPTVYMDDEGVYYDLRSGKPDPALRPGDFTAYAVSGGFLRKGVTIGSRSGDARIFIGEMSEFFAEKLG